VADFGVYWRNYGTDVDCYGLGPTRPFLRWPTKSVRLLNRTPGDRLWFFVPWWDETASQDMTVSLAQVFRVRDIGDNEEEDGEYPAAIYPREVRADPSAWAWLNPFAPVARIVGCNGRLADGEWRDVEVPVGSLRQGPRRLSTAAVRALFDLLRPEVCDQHQLVEGP
jgi:hypothetical protein